MFFDMYNTLNNLFLNNFAYCNIILYLCMAKKKKGGRKPVNPAEKVILVGFYVKKNFVDKVGGMDKAREIARETIETYDNY